MQKTKPSGYEPLAKANLPKEGYEEMTVDQILRALDAVVRKPQRLINLSLDEECQRVLDSWPFFDWLVWLASFASLEKLGKHARRPETFREFLKQLVIVMSDQLPFWAKLQPGKQVYHKSEIQDVQKRKPLTAAELAQSQKGGGSQENPISLDGFNLDQEGLG